MEIKRENILSLQIDHVSDAGVCRRKAVSLAKEMGFDEVKTGEVAIMVTELVTNVMKHGGGKGKLVVCEYSDANDHKAIEVWCCDTGNGISDLGQAMKDGHSAKNTLGLGMGTIRRFSDEMELNPTLTNRFRETYFAGCERFKNCIRTVKYLPNKNLLVSNRTIEVGAMSRSKPGETLNGDAYAISHLSPTLSIASVIDGLGHGKEANLASQLAREQILLKPELPVDALMQHIHNALRGTRGATIGLAKIDTEKQKISFSGIGNIESFLTGPSGKKNLISFGGIMGHNMRTPRIYEFDYKPGDNLCMYSDGITTRWKTDDVDWHLPTQKIAENILNLYARPNDDATVLIVRHTP